MSAYHQVFIRSSHPADQLVADVCAAAGTPAAAARSGRVAYSGSAGHAAVELEMSHALDDDAALDFTAYPVLLTIRDFDRDRDRQEELARSIFGGLASRGYSLLLVFDLQQLLDRCGDLPVILVRRKPERSDGVHAGSRCRDRGGDSTQRAWAREPWQGLRHQRAATVMPPGGRAARTPAIPEPEAHRGSDTQRIAAGATPRAR